MSSFCKQFQENSRGRFLKVSETFTRGYSRFQIFIPADGMEEFNNQANALHLTFRLFLDNVKLREASPNEFLIRIQTLSIASEYQTGDKSQIKLKLPKYTL